MHETTTELWKLCPHGRIKPHEDYVSVGDIDVSLIACPGGTKYVVTLETKHGECAKCAAGVEAVHEAEYQDWQQRWVSEWEPTKEKDASIR